ncbi:MAG: hypothetical protein ACI4EY_02570 [Lachnospiraceae bacterium]
MIFESKKIGSKSIRINGKIKKAIDAYNNKKVPMRVLLTDFLAVKSKSDELAAADNPWVYFYKGIEGHEVESGVSSDESLFRFAAMTLKNQKPSDVINATFFSNKTRNDSDFELQYVLPLFLKNIKSNDCILFVNPSPDIVCAVEESVHGGNRYYAVADKTVADLYKIQFPNAEFCSFDQMYKIKGIDAVLITNRDQKARQTQTLLQCLHCCEDSAKVVGLVPCAWLDNPESGAYVNFKEMGFAVQQLLIVDTKATASTPRKKMIMLLEKGNANTVEVFQSFYDVKTKTFLVSESAVHIGADAYMKSDKTVLSCLKSEFTSEADNKILKYNKAEEYKISEEISLFCKVYSGRKNKYAGVAYYREIKDTQLKTWGKKLSADIEKGLRANSKEEVIGALDNIIFDDSLYPIIRADIGEKYIAPKRLLSLKTIWFYCWSYLADSKKYDHEYVCQLFKQKPISEIMPQIQTGAVLLEAAAKSLSLDVDDVPYKAIEQMDMILKTAVKHRLLVFDPLESYVAEYTSRATERQQEVRNALVKKHFSTEEEMNIFNNIVKVKNVDDRKVFSCTQKSLLLSVVIRLFTGMAIREVAALNWDDFKPIEGTDSYQFIITKFVDVKGKIVLHSARENWKRFRIVPSAKVLSYLLNDRKKYLLDKGIDKEYLEECPIVLQEERITDMQNRKSISHCRPEKISALCNELIRKADIPGNEIILPDDKSDLVTDFNRYHGDIFLSNFRHKANHAAYMTMGEINYMIGVNAPDTFSRHYCDYTNDFLQAGIVQKLCRWEVDYEGIVAGVTMKGPERVEEDGDVVFVTGPFSDGVATVDLIVENKDSADVKVSASSTHGITVNKTIY